MLLTERAYLAGLFDGEGCISLGNRRYYTPSVVIAQQRAGVLAKYAVLLREVGIQAHLKIKIGTRTGHEITHLTVHGRTGVFRFLVVVHPFVEVKRREVDLTFQLLELMGQQGNRLSESDLKQRHELAIQIRRDRRRPRV